MGYSIREAKKTAVKVKKYVRVDEGAEMFSMGTNKFHKLAIEAKAMYKVGRMNLVNIEIFENYLEGFRKE